MPTVLIQQSRPSPSFFITLVEMTDAARRGLEEIPKMHEMIHHGLKLAEYRAFLHDLYHRLAFLPDRQRPARSATSLPGSALRALRAHRGRKGHETWVLDDIEAMGGDVASIKASPPSAPVQAMIAFNYHGAERVHPCSVLGMLYMLEVVSSVYAGRTSESIARAIGRDVDAGGFKFLSSHATMDVDHLAKLNLLVKKVLEPAAQQSIINSTRVNFFQFGLMFREGGFSSLVEG